MSSDQKEIGKAYGFFKCDASKEAIESELPKIRSVVGTPAEMELYLSEGIDNLKHDKELEYIALGAKNEGCRYVMDASFPGKSNRKTADETADILNQAYNTALFRDNEPFTGGIVYKEGKNYVLKK